MNSLPALDKIELVALNTLGLTGAEILLADLSLLPEVLALPGQNFIQTGNVTYRPHLELAQSARSLFEEMSLHQYTRRGHCWAGLTKSMSPSLQEAYRCRRAKHCEIFSSHLAPSAPPATIFATYIWAYHQAMETRRPEARYVIYFGSNIIINSASYPEFGSVKIIDFTNSPSKWLATIGYRMVWDNIEALKFWVVNSLCNFLYAQEHPASYLAIDADDLFASRSGAIDQIRSFLQLPSTGKALASEVDDGFIHFDRKLVAKIENNQLALEKIYDGERIYETARSLSQWAGDFVADDCHRALLRRYADYWNSTTHTNFDWIGPIENDIMQKVEHMVQLPVGRSLSVQFYHDYFQINSDDFENPKGNLEHYLGMLEDEIVIPAMPSYARIALVYLENVARNYLKRPYSGKMIRETRVWRELLSLRTQGYFELWAMEEKWQQTLVVIDQAEAAMRPFYSKAPLGTLESLVPPAEKGDDTCDNKTLQNTPV